MPTWDELFRDEKFRAVAPEAEVYKLVNLVEERFGERPLRIWDLGCGAGRHTAVLAQMGCEVYASDVSPNAIDLTREKLNGLGLESRTALADMTANPWPDLNFHAIFSWDVIHHNTLSAIKSAFDMIHRSLVPGGMFMGTILSDKAGNFGKGREIEPGTFIDDQGNESGVLHHFFDEAGIRDLFKEWEFMILAEEITRYVEAPEQFWEWTPFRFTKWNVLARKRV